MKDKQYTCILMRGSVRYFLQKIYFLRDTRLFVTNKATWSTSNKMIVPLTEVQASAIVKEIKNEQRDVRAVKIEHILH